MVVSTSGSPVTQFAIVVQDESNDAAAPGLGNTVTVNVGSGTSFQVDKGDFDLSGLSFCDISGIRALVDIALELDHGRSLLLHGLPEQLEKVMRVTGWSELPSLALCMCGADLP